jgi:hypothetical protein
MLFRVSLRVCRKGSLPFSLAQTLEPPGVLKVRQFSRRLLMARQKASITQQPRGPWRLSRLTFEKSVLGCDTT